MGQFFDPPGGHCSQFAIGIAGALTFIAAYIYCTATYGFLLGFGLGWLPSGILAAIVGFAVVLLWGPVLLLVLYYFLR